MYLNVMFISLLRQRLPSIPSRCPVPQSVAGRHRPRARAFSGTRRRCVSGLPKHYRLDIRLNGLGNSDVLGILLVQFRYNTIPRHDIRDDALVFECIKFIEG